MLGVAEVPWARNKPCEAAVIGGISSRNMKRTHLTATHSTSMPTEQQVDAVYGKSMLIIAY